MRNSNSFSLRQMSMAILLIIAIVSSIISTTWMVPSMLSAQDGRPCLDQHIPATATTTDMTRQVSSQDNAEYDFTVAICLITRDGEAYFQEWVDYHLLAMQFDAIYVYDNSEKFDLKRWHENSRVHPLYNSVEIQHKPGPGYMKKENKFLQNVVYDDCVQQYGKDPNGSKHDYLCIRDGLMGHWCDKSKGTIKAGTPDHIQSRPGELFDDKAWRLLTAKVPKYRIFDTPEWVDLY